MGSRIRPGTAAVVVAIPGIVAFVLAVVAENKKVTEKSDFGNFIKFLFLYIGSLNLEYSHYFPGSVFSCVAGNTTTCYYPSDPTLGLGVLSVIFLFISAILFLFSILYPYNGKMVSVPILSRSPCLVIFAFLSMTLFLVAEGLLLWAIIMEVQYRHDNVHSGPQLAQCPIAKPGLLGGAAFLALDATLFFLISLMLTTNARSDYFEEIEEDTKGSYGEVTTYPPPDLDTPEKV